MGKEDEDSCPLMESHFSLEWGKVGECMKMDILRLLRDPHECKAASASEGHATGGGQRDMIRLLTNVVIVYRIRFYHCRILTNRNHYRRKRSHVPNFRANWREVASQRIVRILVGIFIK